MLREAQEWVQEISASGLLKLSTGSSGTDRKYALQKACQLTQVYPLSERTQQFIQGSQHPHEVLQPGS